MNTEEESALDVEIEALKAIYIHELSVDRSETRTSDRLTTVKVSLHPATADNADEQYVRLDLVLSIPAKYPDIVPDIAIRNSRGLSDEKIKNIQLELKETAESNIGCPMLYQLIEVAKDHLTEENIPCCQCTICLYGFVEGDVFTKTQCYHYFHSHCLARFIRHALEQISREEQESSKRPPCLGKTDTMSDVLCPVCRLPISQEDMVEKDYPPPVELTRQPEFSVTPEMLRLQHDMAELYLRQQSRGAIINVDAEKKKFLLEISAVPESSARGTIEIQHRHQNQVGPAAQRPPGDRAMSYRYSESCSSYSFQQKQLLRKDQCHQQHSSCLPRNHEERLMHSDMMSSSMDREQDDSPVSPAEGTRKTDRQYRSHKPVARGYRQQCRKQGHTSRNNFSGLETGKPHEWNGMAGKPQRGVDNLRQPNNVRPTEYAPEKGEGSGPRSRKSHSPAKPRARRVEPDFDTYGDEVLESRQGDDVYRRQHDGNHRRRSYGRWRDSGRASSRRDHPPPEVCRSTDGR